MNVAEFTEYETLIIGKHHVHPFKPCFMIKQRAYKSFAWLRPSASPLEWPRADGFCQRRTAVVAGVQAGLGR